MMPPFLTQTEHQTPLLGKALRGSVTVAGNGNTAEIVRVLVKGPAGWSLLSSLFLKPKWLVLTNQSINGTDTSHNSHGLLYF